MDTSGLILLCFDIHDRLKSYFQENSFGDRQTPEATDPEVPALPVLPHMVDILADHPGLVVEGMQHITVVSYVAK